MKTQSQVRSSFWESHPEFSHLRRSRKRQNDYPADVRVAFVNYVDGLAKDGVISRKLAERVTL